MAKLTNTQALAIFLDPRPNEEIASEYGVSVATVFMIKAKRTWKCIHPRPPATIKPSSPRRLGVDEMVAICKDRRPFAEIARDWGLTYHQIASVKTRRSNRAIRQKAAI